MEGKEKEKAINKEFQEVQTVKGSKKRALR